MRTRPTPRYSRMSAERIRDAILWMSHERDEMKRAFNRAGSMNASQEIQLEHYEQQLIDLQTMLEAAA